MIKYSIFANAVERSHRTRCDGYLQIIVPDVVIGECTLGFVYTEKETAINTFANEPFDVRGRRNSRALFSISHFLHGHAPLAAFAAPFHKGGD